MLANINGTDKLRTFVPKLVVMEQSLSRFDVRLPVAQKEFFEYAANLGGYRTLTELVISAVQSKADEIIKKHSSIMASKKDQQIFYDAIMNPPAPGKKLSAAARNFNKTSKQK